MTFSHDDRAIVEDNGNEVHFLAMIACFMIIQAVEDILEYQNAPSPSPAQTRRYLSACMWGTCDCDSAFPLELCLEMINEALCHHGADVRIEVGDVRKLFRALVDGKIGADDPRIGAIRSIYKHSVVLAGKKGNRASFRLRSEIENGAE